MIKEEVDAILLQENKNHFRQAEDTPCCKIDVAQDILKGVRKEERGFKLRYRVDNTTKQLLKQLKRRETDPVEVSQDINVRNIIQGFKLWKESTSTSPSGRTLSLYKVWIKAEGNEKQISEFQFFNMIQKVIWLAVETGIPPDR